MANLDAAHTKRDEYLKSNIHNLVEQAYRRGRVQFSCFLDERERALAQEILNHDSCQNYLFYGGAEGCERVMLGVFPEEIPPEASAFPVRALRISNTADAELSHRDYLGSLMALQIERDCIGDIAVTGHAAVVFLSEKVLPFVEGNLTRIGRFTAELEEVSCEGLTVGRETEELTGTVPSLRLDCIVAMLLNKSRRVAEETIAARLVRLNGLEAVNGTKQLSLGDTIAIRGAGKFILGGECRKTKKDRLWITIQKLV